ncbi:MAG: Mov34/MPN/PAD-1 family protein, partial [Nitrospirota bacterium]
MDRIIRIPKKNIEDMISHARSVYPQECCGLLAGNSGIASNTYRMTNIDQSQFSYLMEPKEQFVALKDMRKKGIEMIAI